MKTHSTKEVADAGGVSYRTLNRWVRQGLLAPPERTSDGRSGVHAIWTAAHLRRVTKIARLRAQGLSITQIAARLQEEA